MSFNPQVAFLGIQSLLGLLAKVGRVERCDQGYASQWWLIEGSQGDYQPCCR